MFKPKPQDDQSGLDRLCSPLLAEFGVRVKKHIALILSLRKDVVVQQRMLTLLQQFPHKAFLPPQYRFSLPLDHSAPESSQAIMAEGYYQLRLSLGRAAVDKVKCKLADAGDLSCPVVVKEFADRIGATVFKHFSELPQDLVTQVNATLFSHAATAPQLAGHSAAAGSALSPSAISEIVSAGREQVLSSLISQWFKDHVAQYWASVCVVKLLQFDRSVESAVAALSDIKAKIFKSVNSIDRLSYLDGRDSDVFATPDDALAATCPDAQKAKDRNGAWVVLRKDASRIQIIGIVERWQGDGPSQHPPTATRAKAKPSGKAKAVHQGRTVRAPPKGNARKAGALPPPRAPRAAAAAPSPPAGRVSRAPVGTVVGARGVRRARGGPPDQGGGPAKRVNRAGTSR